MLKAHEWREHIARCSESGGDVAAYCAEHGLKPKTMIWWRSELRRREREGRTGHKRKTAKQPRMERPRIKLARVVCGSPPRVEPPSSSVSLRIAVAGAELSVGAGCDHELLRTALVVLREGVR